MLQLWIKKIWDSASVLNLVFHVNNSNLSRVKLKTLQANHRDRRTVISQNVEGLAFGICGDDDSHVLGKLRRQPSPEEVLLVIVKLLKNDRNYKALERRLHFLCHFSKTMICLSDRIYIQVGDMFLCSSIARIARVILQYFYWVSLQTVAEANV